MAITYIDGFDSGDLTRYTYSSVTSTSAIGGRAGKQVGIINSVGSIAKAYTGRTEVSIGVRIYVSAGTNCPIINTNNDNHPSVSVNNTQSGLEVTYKRGNNVEQTFTCGEISRNTWYYVELAYLHSSTGYVTVKLNGVTTHSYSGTTLGSSGASEASQWLAKTFSSTATMYLDDLYIGDGELLGPVTISSLVPTSDKTSTWTRSTDDLVAGQHWSLIDDQPASMSDYLYATAGSALTDTYGLTPPAGMGVIPVIQVNANGLSSDGGSAPVTLFADGQAGSTLGLGASPTNISQIFPTAASSAPWTGTNLGTAAFGIRSS